MKSTGKEMEGKSHPVQDLVQEVRVIFLSLGFDEIENQIFIPEDDVYKQYGSEAPVVLDRCYYLAGLPRPDIGLGGDKIDEVINISAGIDVRELKNILREFREGSVGGDDLCEEMVSRLDVTGKEAVEVVGLFADFMDIKPEATKITLRSHMTAAWFPTLRAMRDTHELPLNLFSIGLRFRREQRLDATHLRAHYGASCVIMDEKQELEEGMRLTEDIMKKLGFNEMRFVQKPATSNYYEQGTEYEIYSGDIEVADCGLYCRKSLKNYGISCDVFNLGFGLERILMVRGGKDDVREVLYPQFYSDLELSDEEVANSAAIEMVPETEEGSELAKAIESTARKYANEKSPCKFPAWRGRIHGREVEVYVVEKEENTLLLGPAALNEIYGYDGGIYGIPQEAGKLKKNLEEIRREGVASGLSYIRAVANLFARGVEESAGGGKGDLVKKLAYAVVTGSDGKEEILMQVKMAKTPGDVNIRISNRARRYITAHKKGIYIRGPVFTAVVVRYTN